MKRKELLKKLRKHARENGYVLEVTEGAKHTKIRMGERMTVVPRHAEINEMTAKSILKQMGVWH